jgi:predicted HAD superfamily Cof-like phosphohydrolase
VTPLEQVTEFHQAFGCAINEPWTPELADLRATLITEEHTEVQAALRSGNRANVAQELADLAYVTIGSAVTFGLNATPAPAKLEIDYAVSLPTECLMLKSLLAMGSLGGITIGISWTMRALYGAALVHHINLDAAITAVHIANMSKLGSDGKPILRFDGKVLKGLDYRPPNLSLALEGSR